MEAAEQQWIALARDAGDLDAFTSLVRLHQGAVRAFLRARLCQDSATADDLAQETFLTAHQRIAEYRGEGRFLSWLMGIAYRRMQDHVRAAGRRQRVHERAAGETAAEAETSPAESHALRADVARALASLPEVQRLATHLCHMTGLTHEEAAVALDLPLGTLKSHLAQARVHLARQLAVWNSSPAPRP